MNKVVRNERKKHTASFLNSVAAAFITTGILTPFVALVLGTVSSTLDWTIVAASSGICSLVALSLHLAGNGILGDMEE